MTRHSHHMSIHLENQSLDINLLNFVPLCGAKVCLRRLYTKASLLLEPSQLIETNLMYYSSTGQSWILAGRPETEEGLPIVPPPQEDTEDIITLDTSKTKDSTPLRKKCTPLPTVTHPSPCSSGKPDYTVSKVCQYSQSCCLYLHSLQELAEAIVKTVQAKKSMEQIICDRKHPIRPRNLVLTEC